MPFLSIIIPVFNEEKRIHKTFEHLKNFLEKHSFKTEIIFVDDGSQDNSKLIIQNSKLRKQYKNKIKIVSYRPNRGKGYALKQGVKKASGKWILLIDADMSIPLSNFESLKSYLTKDYPILSGSRDEASRIKAKQGLLRRTLSKGFRLLSQIITGVTISDITCGFKCFKNKTAKKIFSQLTTSRWAYDTEIFMIAKKENILVTQIPVSWTEDKGTTINIRTAMIGSLKDLIRMRSIIKNEKLKEKSCN